MIIYYVAVKKKKEKIFVIEIRRWTSHPVLRLDKKQPAHGEYSRDKEKSSRRARRKNVYQPVVSAGERECVRACVRACV